MKKNKEDVELNIINTYKIITIGILCTIIILIVYAGIQTAEDMMFIERNNKYCEDLHGSEYKLQPVNSYDIIKTGTLGYVCCTQNEYLNNKGEWVRVKECEEETWIKK